MFLCNDCNFKFDYPIEEYKDSELDEFFDDFDDVEKDNQPEIRCPQCGSENIEDNNNYIIYDSE